MEEASRFIPDPQEVVLVVIDIQERLLAAMPEEVRPKILRNAGILVKAAREFGYTIILLEQYPQGLRHTVVEIKDLIPEIDPIEKVAFNCCDVPAFTAALEEIGRRDVILCGMESHICILQTSFGLMKMGKRVFVSADAVCSRAKLNWQLSLDLMRQAGVLVASTEMLLFMLNNTAGTENFTKLSRMVK
jgi:nicotinamidase-related amidase